MPSTRIIIQLAREDILRNLQIYCQDLFTPFALDFIKKDMPLKEDQYIDVQDEEPKSSGTSTTGPGKTQIPHVNPPGEAYEELDDMMFDMTTNNTKQSNAAKGTKGNPQTPNTQSHTTYVNETC